jgi:trk system potassium uptake protein TrkA
MRFVFVGAGALSVRTARILAARRHEVVIVEKSMERIEALADDFDCGFLHGDGTRPHVLKDADPPHSDLLFCLTGNDQDNIIASLVGRSLGFARVVTRIDDEEFEHICIELGLEDTVIPARTTGRYLADIAEGHDILELSSAIKGEARVFLFAAGEADEGPVSDLALPAGARVTHLYREGELVFADADTRLERGDEVVVIAQRKDLEALRERWGKGGNAPGRAAR